MPPTMRISSCTEGTQSPIRPVWRTSRARRGASAERRRLFLPAANLGDGVLSRLADGCRIGFGKFLERGQGLCRRGAELSQRGGRLDAAQLLIVLEQLREGRHGLGHELLVFALDLQEGPDTGDSEKLIVAGQVLPEVGGGGL